MADPILLAYGKGQMAGFLADPDGVIDMVSSKEMTQNGMEWQTYARIRNGSQCDQPMSKQARSDLPIRMELGRSACQLPGH